jgi:hypothetical protein
MRPLWRFVPMSYHYGRTIRFEYLRNHRSFIATEHITNFFVKLSESYFCVFFPGKNQQRTLIFLTVAFRSLHGVLRHENDCPHKRRISFGVDFDWRRQEISVWIAILIARSRRGRTDVGGHPLRRHLDPLAVIKLIPIFRKPQLPQCCVNAHL